MSAWEEHYENSEAYKTLVLKRLDTGPREYACPREESDMTPCIGRDGKLACTDDGYCAGCNRTVAGLLLIERKKLTAEDPNNPTM
jgi:hypothetical protein